MVSMGDGGGRGGCGSIGSSFSSKSNSSNSSDFINKGNINVNKAMSMQLKVIAYRNR